MAPRLFTEVIRRVQPTSQQRVAKTLLTSFARLLEDQFEDHQILAAEGSQFEADGKKFLSDPTVQSLLIEPFDDEVTSLDDQGLSRLWCDLGLTPLPAEFDWEIIARRYLTKTRNAIEKDPELCAVADHRTLAHIRDDMGRLAGLDRGFRLDEYAARIRTRYGLLKFDSFHVTGSDLERRVQLSKVFVPQNVKEDLPPLELPKEHVRRLVAAGEMGARHASELAEEAQLEQYRRRYQDAPQRDVVAMLRDPSCPHAAIIGDPGSGKSSLLEWLLLQWADHPEKHPLPLFVELRQCARDTADWKGDFWQYFAAAADPLFAFNAHDLRPAPAHEALSAAAGWVRRSLRSQPA